MSIAALPEWDDAIARLAVLIAGADADRERIVGARRIAEAEIDLLRVRRAKLMLLERQTPRPHRRLPGFNTVADRIRPGRRAPSPNMGTDAGRGAVGEAGPAAAALGEIAREMMRLDRYERRALSRRNSAVRDLDGLGRAPSARRRPEARPAAGNAIPESGPDC